MRLPPLEGFQQMTAGLQDETPAQRTDLRPSSALWREDLLRSEGLGLAAWKPRHHVSWGCPVSAQAEMEWGGIKKSCHHVLISSNTSNRSFHYTAHNAFFYE